MGVGSAASVIYPDGSKAAGIEFTDWQVDEVHPGCSRTKERLEFMDENGIWAQIVYPNVMGFAGQGRAPMGAPKREPVDADLRLVSTRIFNDAMAEMQADSGGRLLPMALLPWWDIDLAVEEAERCHAVGMRGVNINSDPQLHGMQDLGGEYWTPLWELCSDKGLPVNFHIGASDSTMSWYGETPWPSLQPEEKLAVGGTMMFISNAKVILNLITSGLLERFPKLNFVSVESGIGWIPFVLETLDYSLAESGGRCSARTQRASTTSPWIETRRGAGSRDSAPPCPAPPVRAKAAPPAPRRMGLSSPSSLLQTLRSRHRARGPCR